MSTSRGSSWRDGPEFPNQFDGNDAIPEYPGQFFGLPKEGSGAQASVARRMGAVCIDWLLALLAAITIHNLTGAFGGTSTLTFFIWMLIGIIGGWLFARTPGMALLGMGIARVDKEAPIGLWRAVARTLFTAFILPAALVDADGRGMHDRATSTTVLRS